MSKIDDYIEKYSIKHHITPEVAKTHKLVQIVKEHYESEEQREEVDHANTTQGLSVNCS